MAHLGALRIGQASSVSLAAWIGSLVLILWYLNLVTPISLFANLAVVPIAFLILAVALLSLICAPALPGLRGRVSGVAVCVDMAARLCRVVRHRETVGRCLRPPMLTDRVARYNETGAGGAVRN